MRHICRLSVGLALLLAATCAASPADAALRRIAASTYPAVGGAAAGIYAYAPNSTSLVVQTPSARRTYTVPAGCRVAGLTTDAAALDCTPLVLAPVVVDLATGRLDAVPVAAAVTAIAMIDPLAIGSQWVLGAERFSTDGVHSEEKTVAVKRTTGAIVDLGAADPLGVHSYPDLNAPGLRAQLCSPITRLAASQSSFDLTKYAAVEMVGQSVLQSTPTSQVLQRCGHHGHIERFPSNTPASDPVDPDAVLSTDTVAWVTARTVKLENLTNRTVRSFAWPTKAAPRLALVGRRLLISAPAAPAGYTIYETS
jgi:hypothetical protein